MCVVFPRYERGLQNLFLGFKGAASSLFETKEGGHKNNSTFPKLSSSSLPQITMIGA